MLDHEQDGDKALNSDNTASPPAESAASESKPASGRRTTRKRTTKAKSAADDASATPDIDGETDGATEAKPTRRRTTRKKAAATDAADQPAADHSEADQSGLDEPGADQSARPGVANVAFQPPTVLFQPPAIESPPAPAPSPSPGRPPAPEPEETTEQPSTESDSGSGDDDDDRDDEGGRRRRRRRGGRRRNKAATDDDTDRDDSSSGDESGESESDESDGERGRASRRGRGKRTRDDSKDGARDGDRDDASADADESADEDDEGDDDESGDDEAATSSGSRRRRRRRRRKGETVEASPDDPEATVVKVREPRKSDEVSSVEGSTRLEAKRQRRREGREAGRRRPPILSESEFLARRESVERTMVIRQHGDRTQIGVLEDDVLVEHYVTREAQSSMIGNVYLGRVQNVLPSMEAAFIDIGRGRNAVLYAGEVDWSGLGLDGQPKRIEAALKSGQTVLVQVTKDPAGHKGARLTSQISIPGRYLVYVPRGSMNGISRKLPDTERSRLKQLLKDIVPEEAGVVVRTAAEGASEEELSRDVARLKAQWEAIEKNTAGGQAPSLLYAEPDLLIKVVRDLFTEDFNRLVVSGDDAWDMVEGYVRHVAPHLIDRLERWSPPKDVFASHRIDEQIMKALDRKVWLPSGGSLIIERTEAMTVIDVNTGKFTGAGGNLEETVTKNNLEAAEEIVRQLRLRDIGGIIVVDFIDMVLESNRDLVLRRLVECLGRDRTKHQVAEVTSLGLVQMTRKRIGTGLLESFSEPCEACNGRGVHVHLEPIEPPAPAAPSSDGGRRSRRRRRGGNGGAAAQHEEEETTLQVQEDDADSSSDVHSEQLDAAPEEPDESSAPEPSTTSLAVAEAEVEQAEEADVTEAEVAEAEVEPAEEAEVAAVAEPASVDEPTAPESPDANAPEPATWVDRTGDIEPNADDPGSPPGWSGAAETYEWLPGTTDPGPGHAEGEEGHEAAEADHEAVGEGHQRRCPSRPASPVHPARTNQTRPVRAGKLRPRPRTGRGRGRGHRCRDPRAVSRTVRTRTVRTRTVQTRTVQTRTVRASSLVRTVRWDAPGPCTKPDTRDRPGHVGLPGARCWAARFGPEGERWVFSTVDAHPRRLFVRLPAPRCGVCSSRPRSVGAREPELSEEPCKPKRGRRAVYAIVRSGGHQHKVAVGDVLEVNRLSQEAGAKVQLPAVLLVDGEKVTSDAAALGKVEVTAEVLADAKGPKIHILKFKNKTGYRRRQGHRQKLTRLKVTGIDTKR